MKKLFKYIKPYWFFALLSPLMMIGETAIDLMQPTLMSEIVDIGVIGSDFDFIISTGIKMIILVAFGGLCGMSASFFASAAAQNFGCDLRNDVFRRVMSLSIEQTDKFTTGSLVTRLTNDITMVQDLVASILRMFIRAPMNFIGGIIMAISLNVKFSLVLLITLPIQLVIVCLIIFMASPLFTKVQTKLDKVNSVVQENVTGARVVKAYVREEHEICRFDDANKDLRDTTYRVQKLMAFLNPCMMIVMNLSVIAIIIIGNLQVQAGAMEVGKIMAAITYTTQILMSLMMVGMMFQTISRGRASAKRILEVLESDPVITSGDYGERGGDGTVSFKNVSFYYPNTVGRPVLNDVDLEVGHGEYVAILGATGSGKTSLVNLITRFYDADSGEVVVDGVNVRDYDISALRSKISMVLQKSEMFSGTIMDNIRWGNPDATDEEVIEAAKIAQAHEFISEFNDGYHTYIGEKGSSLSGGQKQRIAIARAIVRKPEIIIFDDSTSALDLGTEARLRKALREQLKDTTIIMIAQRIASVMQADKIAVIENGVITACAPHSELMKTSAAYVDIYNSQLKNNGGEQ